MKRWRLSKKQSNKTHSDAVGWNGLGDLQHALGHNDDAIYSFLKAIEFSPDYAPSWTSLGNSYLAEGQLDEALAAHLKAIEIDPYNVDSRLALGDIYKLQGKNEDASMAYRTVIELDPKNAPAWNKLADLHYSNGAYDEALHTYQKAVDCDQDCLLSYGNLASIYVQKGRHPEAIPLLQKGIELSDDTTDSICLWNRLGDVYRHMDDYEHAMAAYRNADALDPQKSSAEPESSPAELDPQFSPSEDFFVQPAMNFKLRCMQEHGLQAEPAEPAVACPPESLPVVDESATIPGEPEMEILSWLDGLTSAMTTYHQLETSGPTGSNPDENEGALGNAIPAAGSRFPGSRYG